MTYDDAGNLLTKTYPDGEVVTTSYTAQGWFSGLTTQQGSANVTLLSNVAYTGTGGAAGLMTGASLGGGIYQYTASYNLLLQRTDSKLIRTTGGATLFEQVSTFDGVGNVTSRTTTLPQGTDVQWFCYDEQNRLTWAGSVGTPPCTGTPITPGSLTSAQYTQSFSYDTLDRLTSGPQGSYTYGNSQHLHAVTSIGSGYTASYDAAGNMTCRAPTNATTCTGISPTGAQLTYDNEGRLAQWQSAPSNPTTSISYLYDGEGHRVVQQQVSGGTTTTTVYVGNLEEVTTSGSTTTTTTYYYGGGQRIALAVNGVFSYLCADGLGSMSVALDANGNVQASQLYAPYGVVRYSSGTMPGSYGFTGQHTDSATGLDYYNARYYDPAAGRFASADTVLAGMDRYGYVGDNPATYTDPSGHGPEPPEPPPECADPECITFWIIITAGAAEFAAFLAWLNQGKGVVRSTVLQYSQRLHQHHQQPNSQGHRGMLTWIRRKRRRLTTAGNTIIQDLGKIQDGESAVQATRILGLPEPEGHPVEEPIRNIGPGVPQPSPEAQNLPTRTKDASPGQAGDPTDCVLVANGRVITLTSTNAKNSPGVMAGTNGKRGFVNPANGNPLGPDSSNSHCEAHAIATMIANGWQSADLWINNVPCVGQFGCATLMSDRLDPGMTLNVYVSDLLHFGTDIWVQWGPIGGYRGLP